MLVRPMELWTVEIVGGAWSRPTEMGAPRGSWVSVAVGLTWSTFRGTWGLFGFSHSLPSQILAATSYLVCVWFLPHL
jgi:hypothetical protein